MSRFIANYVRKNFRSFALGLTTGFSLRDVSHHNDISLTADDQEREAKKQISRDAVECCDVFRTSNLIDGMSVAISVNGSLILKQGFGWKDLEKLIPVDGDMRGDVASVSKLITAHLMMQLHEDQDNDFDVFDNLRFEACFLDKDLKVDLDVVDKTTRVKGKHQTILPYWEYIYTAWLLSHRSGIRHYHNSPRENDAALPMRYENALDALGMFAEDNFEQWPGSFKYSSYGYNLAGAIIEQLTDRDFRDHAADELKRWNMRDSFFPHVHEDVIYDYARGYTYDNNNSERGATHCQFTDKAYKYPSGGMISTVGDLVKFGDVYSAIYQNLLDDNEPGKTPIKSETVKMMWSNHSKSSFFHKVKDRKIGSCSRGLGWKVKNVSRKRNGEEHFFTTLYHVGIATGFTAMLSTGFVTRENLAKKKLVRYNVPPKPDIPDKFELVSCSFNSDDDDEGPLCDDLTQFVIDPNPDMDQNMRLVTDNELAHNGNIKHNGEFEGISIAIIANKGGASLEELYWKLIELIFRVNSENGYCLINFPEEVGTNLGNSYCCKYQ